MFATHTRIQSTIKTTLSWIVLERESEFTCVEDVNHMLQAADVEEVLEKVLKNRRKSICKAADEIIVS